MAAQTSEQGGLATRYAAAMLIFAASVHGSDGEGPCPLSVTFEYALAALELLPRLFIEPDGSFVWTGTAEDGQPWQIDGNLIDQGDRLAYVELKGRCPEAQLDLLLKALGWPQAKLAFHIVRKGVALDEVAFRRLAATGAGAV